VGILIVVPQISPEEIGKILHLQPLELDPRVSQLVCLFSIEIALLICQMTPFLVQPYAPWT
jgi:hypothetical protein